MTTGNSITHILNDYIATSTVDIPVFHPVALKLQQALAQPGYAIEQINQLISVDPGLASQVLRMANSSFYAGLNRVTTIRDAIIRLGAHEVATIAMLASQKDLYHSSQAMFAQVMGSLWKHAYCCAVGSRWLAAKTRYDSLVQEAFLLGLLHDIGKLFLLKVLEEVSTSGKLGRDVSTALLAEVLNNMHVEYGTRLMEKWHLPEIYGEVTQYHHGETWPHNIVLLAIVRLVNLACNKLGIGMRPDPNVVLFATVEAHVLGIKEITLAELEIALEDAVVQLGSGVRFSG